MAQQGKKVKLRTSSWATYEGEWLGSNIRDGRGVQVWADGSRYEGWWKDDKANGRGRMVFAKEGNVYEGGWKNDQMHGLGRDTWPDGSYYQG